MKKRYGIAIMKRNTIIAITIMISVSLLCASCSNNDAAREIDNATILDSVVKETEIETSDTSIETVVVETEDDLSEERLAAYKDALMNLFVDFTFPNGYEAETPFLEGDYYSISDNLYGICDVDSDGRDELMIKWVTACSAGQIMAIYDYDPIAHDWHNEYWGNTYVTFYDNNAFISDSSHNQGWGETIWPYSIFKYNNETDCYDCVGYFECWDKSFTDTNHPEIEFPEECDTDGVGVVYIIHDGDYNQEQEYYSQSEYDQIYEDLMGDASPVEVEFFNLTLQNIESI